MDGWRVGWKDGCFEGWMGGSRDGWTDGGMVERMGRLKDGRTLSLTCNHNSPSTLRGRSVGVPGRS